MTVTSVDIDQQVLREAKEVYGVRTNREAISLALSDAILRRRQLDAVAVLAGIPVDPDPKQIVYDRR